MAQEGRVTLSFPVASDVVVTPARVRPTAVAYDRALHRAPYGSAWFTSGTGDAQPAVFEVETEVTSTSITTAAPLVRALVSDFEDATSMEVPFGTVGSLTLLSFSASPITGGYAVSVRVGGELTVT